MQELAARFIPAADEVGRLQRKKAADCLLFQVIAEQGHYAGRVQPSNTRQGIYAAAPSGVLLASCNNNRAERVIEMLETALAAWEQLPDSERWLPDGGKDVIDTIRWERLYPDDGMVLRIAARDLPRVTPEEQDENSRGRRRGDGESWHKRAWNQDYMWLRRDEMLSFVPAEVRQGESRDVPVTIVERLARLHLVDNVRGQVSMFSRDAVGKAELTSTITNVEGDRVFLNLTGNTRTVERGTWSVGGFRDRDTPAQQERGIETEMFGHAIFDRATQEFIAFTLVAVGERWGGTQYNARERDLQRNPIGFAISLAASQERVAPAFIWEYGWR
ncbi:MAG: hypothetical protein ACR2GY_05185 [Phycisphaerales bacterium]